MSTDPLFVTLIALGHRSPIIAFLDALASGFNGQSRQARVTVDGVQQPIAREDG